MAYQFVVNIAQVCAQSNLFVNILMFGTFISGLFVSKAAIKPFQDPERDTRPPERVHSPFQPRDEEVPLIPPFDTPPSPSVTFLNKLLKGRREGASSPGSEQEDIHKPTPTTLQVPDVQGSPRRSRRKKTTTGT